MKFYVNYDKEALGMLIDYCSTANIDITVSVRYSKKYGKSILIDTYFANLELAKKVIECGFVEMKKEERSEK